MTGEMMEFRITSDLQEVRKNVITTNYPEIKARIDEIVAQYKTRAVTLDTLSSAKADRALLRKAQSGIRDVRKEMREAALSTCAEGEQNCKDIDGALEEGVQYLDLRIKDIENAVKGEKRLRLLDYFTKAVGDMAEWLTFDDCFNPKWLNATYAESTAQMDVCAAIDRCRADLNAIRALHSEFETTLLDEYTRTRNISAVLVKNETLGRMKAAEEERKRKEAEAAAKYEEQKAACAAIRMASAGDAVIEEHSEVGQVIATVDREAFERAVSEPEPTYTVDFRVFGTAAQLDELRVYMRTKGIRYGRVPQE